jgi:hypothetical protein
MLQSIASLKITIRYRNKFIVQANGVMVLKLAFIVTNEGAKPEPTRVDLFSVAG